MEPFIHTNATYKQLYDEHRVRVGLKNCVVLLGDLSGLNTKRFTLVKDSIKTQMQSDVVEEGKSEGLSNLAPYRFKCTMCKEEFSDSFKLKWHTLRHKPKKIAESVGQHRCNTCKKQFTNLLFYKNHLKLHSASKTNQLSLSSNKTAAHKTDVVDERSFKYRCHICKKRFADYYDLYSHKQDHHENKRSGNSPEKSATPSRAILIQPAAIKTPHSTTNRPEMPPLRITNPFSSLNRTEPNTSVFPRHADKEGPEVGASSRDVVNTLDSNSSKSDIPTASESGSKQTIEPAKTSSIGDIFGNKRKNDGKEGTDPLEPIYYCCKKKYYNRVNLFTHMNKASYDVDGNANCTPLYMCCVCNSKFEQYVEWKNHCKSAHKNGGALQVKMRKPKFRCDKCWRRFESSRRLGEHMEKCTATNMVKAAKKAVSNCVRKDPVISDSAETEVASSAPTIPIISIVHSGGEHLKCDTCGQSYDTDETFNSHRSGCVSRDNTELTSLSTVTDTDRESQLNVSASTEICDNELEEDCVITENQPSANADAEVVEENRPDSECDNNAISSRLKELLEWQDLDPPELTAQNSPDDVIEIEDSDPEESMALVCEELEKSPENSDVPTTSNNETANSLSEQRPRIFVKKMTDLLEKGDKDSITDPAQNLYKKMIVREANNSYRMLCCQTVFRKMRTARRHLRSCWTQCAKCSYATCSGKSLRLHYRDIHEIKYICGLCRTTFQLYPELSQHYTNVHECKTCCKRFINLPLHLKQLKCRTP